MSELIAVSCITTFGGLVGLFMINHYWFKKQEARHKYLKDRYSMYQKKALPQQAVPDQNMLGNLAKILPALKDLDLDQVSDLMERFGRGETEPSELGGITELLNNPVVQGFIEQYSKQKQTPETITPPNY